jgi:hypothetical protein
VLLTGDEYRAMARGLADSSAPATGKTALTDWIAEHGGDLGRTYANELIRHYQLFSRTGNRDSPVPGFLPVSCRRFPR